MNSTWLIPSLICLLLGTGLLVLMRLQTKAVFNRPFWLFTLGMLAVFAGVGFLGTRFDSFTTAFWVSESLLFLLGILYILLLYRLFNWVTPAIFWPGLLYQFALAAGGAGLVALVSGMLVENIFVWQVILAVLPFLLPYLFAQSYVFWAAIPVKKYSGWQYPVDAKLPIIEQRDPVAIDFRISHLPDQEPNLVCQVSAPKDKPLGTIFHYLVYDYNTNQPNNPIGIYTDKAANQLAGWVFHLDSHVIDPTKSLKENRIETGAVIEARSFTN